jgi:hypothetical protein
MTSWRTWCRALGTAALAAVLASCAAFENRGSAAALASVDLAGADGQGEQIIVAVRDTPEALPGAGTTPRADYQRLSGYAGSTRSAALAAEVAQVHGLREEAFWTIDPLHLRCMVYRVPQGATAASVLMRLQQDPRVQLAQPLNLFETLVDARPTQAGGYNDPYIGLQHGFAAMGAAQAQRWTRGDGVVVAVIDTAVDGAHPDLAGHVLTQRDFVGSAHPPDATEPHGTEVAGLIAATANNQQGIVGVAPQARVRATAPAGQHGQRRVWPTATRSRWRGPWARPSPTTPTSSTSVWAGRPIPCCHSWPVMRSSVAPSWWARCRLVAD